MARQRFCRLLVPSIILLVLRSEDVGWVRKGVMVGSLEEG